MIANFRLTMSLLLLAALGGCAESPKVRQLSLEDGQTYLAPGGRFSVIVPILVRPGEKELQRSNGDSVTVVFADEFGTLLDIQSAELPADEYAELAGPDQEAKLQQVFEKVVMQDQVDKAYAGAVVKTQDYPYTPVGRAWFATVFIPGGSTMVDPEHRERMGDALRGYLVFPQKGSLYIVATQEIPTSPGRPEVRSDQERADRILGRLKDTVGTMVFH
jgi:hypothetical protein